MYIYKLTVNASHERPDGSILFDKSEHYIAAYCYEHAYNHVVNNLSRADWKIDNMTARIIYVNDIRDSCDHTTDD